MLSYAYAVLENQVRIAVVARGLDPTIRYVHAPKKRRVALVYDLMEPLRSQVDRAVLDVLREHTVAPTGFVITDRGLYWLHSQLTRSIAILAGTVGELRGVATQLRDLLGARD